MFFDFVKIHPTPHLSKIKSLQKKRHNIRRGMVSPTTRVGKILLEPQRKVDPPHRHSRMTCDARSCLRNLQTSQKVKSRPVQIMRAITPQNFTTVKSVSGAPLSLVAENAIIVASFRKKREIPEVPWNPSTDKCISLRKFITIMGLNMFGVFW
jgi:hypothetical protein